MSSPDFARCACTSCNLNIEFPLEGAGMVIACPHCEAATELRLDSSPAAPVAPPAARKTAAPETPLTVEELDGQFAGAVPKTPTSIFYQFGLVLVTITMLILPVIYVGLIGLAGYGVFLWATKFTFLLGGRGGLYVLLFKLLLYATPLISGVVVVLFMIKPLLARRPDHAQPLALNPQNEPVLFAYVSRICAIVGAPPPTRVDIDCNLNASASFRRGLFSMFGNDLVLTIGLPLVAGLDTRQLAGVIAHEFGHFTQGFGMRLTYLIRKVNAWFARVVYQRDAWDVTLEELATEGEDWRLMIMYNFVRLAVWFSRFILKLLMWIGHGIGCFMLRQMEYDADSYEIKVAGTECFEGTFRRMHVLDQVSELAYRDMRVGWNSSRTLPDNFPQWMLYHDARLDAERRTKLEDSMGFQATGLFDTHPSNGDRIKQARRMGTEGIFQLETPATRLFANFDVVAKQVTMLHYEDDLGIPNEMVKFMPVPKDGESLEKESAGSPAEEPSPQRSAFKSKLKLKGKGNE